ncbi:MAG: thioredoxin family protein [Bacteroidia bacterium]
MRLIIFPVLLFLGFSLVFASCSKKGKQQNDVPVGKITVAELANSNRHSWFREEYKSYSPDSLTIEWLLVRNKNISVDIFMGTWCEDTHQQLPRFIKVLDKADVPSQGITMYALDKKKQGIGEITAQNRVEYVPTFIIYYKGREAGRIVEHPKTTIEEDMKDMLQNAGF